MQTAINISRAWENGTHSVIDYCTKSTPIIRFNKNPAETLILLVVQYVMLMYVPRWLSLKLSSIIVSFTPPCMVLKQLQNIEDLSKFKRYCDTCGATQCIRRSFRVHVMCNDIKHQRKSLGTLVEKNSAQLRKSSSSNIQIF